ncbi:Creatinine amidohydrolase [compost metagenome]
MVVLSYWDFVKDPEVIQRLYPDGFLGWDIEHGGVFETSLMLALYPQLVNLEKVVDHPPATFPPYDVFPVDPARTPAAGTLSSAKTASREKGELILDVCVQGISEAITREFPPT